MNPESKVSVAGAASLVDVFQSRALSDPDRVAYRFLEDGEVESTRITYREQNQVARSIAAILEDRKAAGERALLLYPPTLDFVNAFLGCLYAGGIAVPAYPPRSNRCLPRLILTTSASAHLIEPWVPAIIVQYRFAPRLQRFKLQSIISRSPSH